MLRVATLAALLPACVAAAGPGRFSVSGLDGWQEQRFDGKAPTRYRLVDDAGVRVLEADCRASASGLIWRERIDLRRTPVLSWRWRVEHLPAAPDERSRAGDDFVLRVYAVRDGGLAVWRTRSLVYVWAGAAAPGAAWPNPYTSKAQVLALRSGANGAGRWQEERRDLVVDFRERFGLALDHVDGLALMSDCDDSGRSSRAWYGDLRIEAP